MRSVSQDEVVKGINCQIDWRMEYIGDISFGQEEYKLTMPMNIPSAAGVYQIIALEIFEHYVGQSQSLYRRFYRDYQISGYHPKRPMKTNRMVVDWVYSNLAQSRFGVYVCTSANLRYNDAELLKLNFTENKYHRLLVESAIISGHSDLKLVNKN